MHMEDGSRPMRWLQSLSAMYSLPSNPQEISLSVKSVGNDGKVLLWEIKERVRPSLEMLSQGEDSVTCGGSSALLSVTSSRPDDDRPEEGKKDMKNPFSACMSRNRK